MTKVQASLVSLVAAVPGGLLAYGMIQSFLKFASNSPLSFRILSGFTLAFAVLLALLPLAVLIYGGPKKTKAEPAGAGGGTGPLAVSAPQPVVSADGVESIDDLEVAGEADDADFAMAESYEQFPDQADSAEMVEMPEGEHFDVDGMETYEEVPIEEVPADDVEMMETFDGVPFEEVPEEFIDEEPPAKKKKKK